MTEQEAKTKRCIGPADCGRPVEISKRMTNAGDTLTERIRVCIGSACMAWRRDVYGNDNGWCGLAGKP